MSRPKWVFAGITVVAIAWTGWLAYMSVTVAKAPVVSAPQLHFATLVVAAEVTLQGDIAQARIVKQFKDDMKGVRKIPLPQTIKVQWSDKYPKPTQQPMLLALKRSPLPAPQDVYEIAPIPRPDRLLPPVVYHYTESVRIQTERVLGSR
ncbi:MAG TPA: hypothetical protein PLN21_01145 [Gemmatales bacterium]|nr:hypothetical protein [Gemmatales bacterium]